MKLTTPQLKHIYGTFSVKGQIPVINQYKDRIEIKLVNSWLSSKTVIYPLEFSVRTTQSIRNWKTRKWSKAVSTITWPHKMNAIANIWLDIAFFDEVIVEQVRRLNTKFGFTCIYNPSSHSILVHYTNKNESIQYEKQISPEVISEIEIELLDLVYNNQEGH